MSEQTIHPMNQLIEKLAHAVPDLDDLQRTLGTTFKQSNENPYWRYYEFGVQSGSGLIGQGEYRKSKEGNKALLSLSPKADLPIHEADLKLEHWGAIQNFRVNPRIPPEGTDTYIYRIDKTQVSFQLTHVARLLRSVVLEWGVAATGE